jgi:hypothetical protein
MRRNADRLVYAGGLYVEPNEAEREARGRFDASLAARDRPAVSEERKEELVSVKNLIGNKFSAPRDDEI